MSGAMKFVFTKASIQALPLPSKGYVYAYDAKMPSLAVRIGANGSRNYVFCRRMAGRYERVTLGRFRDLSIRNVGAV